MTILLQRGQAAIQAKNFAEALGWFEKAAEENPKDAQAKACLGQTLCWLGKRDEGIGYLRQAGQLLTKKARKTRDISLMLGLTEQLQFWNDYQGALDLGRQAVQINPSVVRGFQLLALTYSRLNQSQSALAAGRQAARLAPDNAMLQILLATLEITEKHIDSARQRLVKVLQRCLTPEERFRAHKELARILDKIGAHDQVFAHLYASAEVSGLVPEVRKQDGALVPSLIKTYQAEFDRDLLTRWSGTKFPKDQPAPAFLIGFMRSGTTLTQEVLASHPEVFVADETDLIVAMRDELERISGAHGNLPARLRKIDLPEVLHLRQFYWKRVRALRGDQLGQRLLVDKTTMNTIDYRNPWRRWPRSMNETRPFSAPMPAVDTA